MTPARFRWGLLFILFGTLVLLQKADAVDRDVWLSVPDWVPFVLIAIGIEKIFTRSRFEFIAYASSVLLVAAVLWVSLASDSSGRSAGFIESSIIREDFDPSVSVIEATIKLKDGELEIRDAGEDLVYGRFGRYTLKPEYSYAVEDGRAMVKFASPRNSWFGGVVTVDADDFDDWSLEFSHVVPLRLVCEGDQSDFQLNLATTPLEALQVSADDADIYLKLGNLRPTVSVSVRGADSKLLLRVPRESSLRVTGVEDEEYLQRVGLTRSNGSFISEGIDTSGSRIEVDLDDRFRSLTIDYY